MAHNEGCILSIYEVPENPGLTDLNDTELTEGQRHYFEEVYNDRFKKAWGE